MLFMKGTRDEPRCGFSRKVVAALAETGVPFDTFDILSDEDVRQGLKTFSNWPTYPQLYAGGELVGGCDIILEMAANGELAEALSSAADASKTALDDRLRALVTHAPVMLFMKGTRDEPRCGFSRKVVGALADAGVAFETFDILSDEEVRQGLKSFSDWPTYPQLYHRGELLGDATSSSRWRRMESWRRRSRRERGAVRCDAWSIFAVATTRASRHRCPRHLHNLAASSRAPPLPSRRVLSPPPGDSRASLISVSVSLSPSLSSPFPPARFLRRLLVCPLHSARGSLV